MGGVGSFLLLARSQVPGGGWFVSSSFEESCLQFCEFLARHDYPNMIVWISPEDILMTDRRFLYVRLPVPNTNQRRASDAFEAAMQRQAGVWFSTVCDAGEVTCCKVWVPFDESERERAMCSKTELKMSASSGESRLRGKGVRNSFLWLYLRLRYRGQQGLKDQLFWG